MTDALTIATEALGRVIGDPPGLGDHFHAVRMRRIAREALAQIAALPQADDGWRAGLPDQLPSDLRVTAIIRLNDTSPNTPLSEKYHWRPAPPASAPAQDGE